MKTTAAHELEAAVHLVDDEAAVRDALSFLLRSNGLAVHTYASGPELLDLPQLPSLRGCVVLDVRMEPMSGLQVHDELITRGVLLPVLFLTGHGDVPMAVAALHKGALDFIEKPFKDDELLLRVRSALALEAERRGRWAIHALEAARLASLSAREREVLLRVAAGKQNKVIADELCVAVRTVEVHRARVYEKLGVRSSAEVAAMLARHQDH
jgi:two-component system response regulator DctR